MAFRPQLRDTGIYLHAVENYDVALHMQHRPRMMTSTSLSRILTRKNAVARIKETFAFGRAVSMLVPRMKMPIRQRRDQLRAIKPGRRG